MGILGSLFGGSKQSSEQGNKAYPYLQGALSGAIGTVNNSFNRLNDELSGGFEGYKDKAGFDSAMLDTMRGVTGASAARGVLNSGMTGRAYQREGTKLSSSFYNNYLDRLKDGGAMGLQAASILAGAGQYGKSSGKSNGGIIPGLFG